MNRAWVCLCHVCVQLAYILVYTLFACVLKAWMQTQKPVTNTLPCLVCYLDLTLTTLAHPKVE